MFVLEVCGALPMFRIDLDHRCPPEVLDGP